MVQEYVWDKEYRESKLLVKENIASRDVVRFYEFLKKEEKVEISGLHLLDLGSGMGRNSFYFAERGANVAGLEISKTAIDIAQKNLAETMSSRVLDIRYVKQSIGEKFPFENESFDIVLDIISSNSLSEYEREVYLAETYRVLKSEGFFFVKTLCKDGDANAKALLKQSPGKEKDTYIMPKMNLTERVWSKEDFIHFYQKDFKILRLEKITRYTRMNNRSYKRNFWICYMKK